jgi:hypothetical protein
VDRKALAPEYRKWNPGGRWLMPRKRGEESKARRSMPIRVLAGRLRRRIVGLAIAG